MPITNQSATLSQLQSSVIASGMTFNPSIDCRNDLVNFYGYTRQQVNAMSDGEVFSILDKIEDMEKGYTEHESSLPVHIADKKCSCGGSLDVQFVDCETRGDCEIYVCECKACNKTVSINYAAEWFEYDCYEEAEEMHQQEITVVETPDTRSIDELDLSVRTYHCLLKAGYKTVQQVKDASYVELSKIRNMGSRSIQELKEVLNLSF
ncbi:hypothetical protein EVU96_09165 [Bacillus infantis]|uniref:DNA-directed RNA polymerase subunit alpha C-terminal domain-containing protein n=1 Tax=Bacillus infantis TaxID=324767 RepID=UPI00101BE448|nr:DNA-directed RNA polymerase subunit alpha C-terminal domain-containing protein [Bacillus infantis]RYI30574.1 hypothetical protein EVU96_09165 [Bacillus infantis]